MDTVDSLLRLPAAREWLLDRSSSREAREDPESFRFSFSGVQLLEGEADPWLLEPSFNTLTLKGYESGLALLWSAPESCPGLRLSKMHTSSCGGLRVVSSRSVGHFSKSEYAIVVFFSWLEDGSLVVSFNKVTFTTRYVQSYRFEWQIGDVLRPSRLLSTIESTGERVMRDQDVIVATTLIEKNNEGRENVERESFWKRWVEVVKMNWEGNWEVIYKIHTVLHGEKVFRFGESCFTKHDEHLLDNIDNIAEGFFNNFVANVSCEVDLNGPFLPSEHIYGDALASSGDNWLLPQILEEEPRESPILNPISNPKTESISFLLYPSSQAHFRDSDSGGASDEKSGTLNPSTLSAERNSTPSGKIYVCVFCEKRCDDEKVLEKHVLVKHAKQAPIRV
eukprot:CAMPEP_0182450500 /NCGR_PEP_ID=MMETSP1172-20130603/41652_1 /TAXON_ID=708627 /ORGANISM="Timspurckia oligopyrenoides, Strain CCMP3278" /LENGTH=392 /DNA_ID=CAMNT_0024648119 /DNA_START=312 /DNA_END=1489 /DNA_ORIENTATION=-